MPHKDPDERRRYAAEIGRRHQAKKTAAKIAALEARIRSRPVWPERDLAWTAGVFEGEGTIAIVASNAGYTRSVVTMTNTDREIIDFLQARWPGLVSVRAATLKHKPAWIWRLQGNFIIGFLEDVLPYFVTTSERRKAVLALESQRARWAGYKLKGHMEKMQKYATAMKALNRKGPATAEAA